MHDLEAFSTQPTGHADPRPGFHEGSLVVQITAEERELGIRTKRLFDARLKRRTPWLIKDGCISLARPLHLAQAEASRLNNGGAIRADDVHREQISALLASVLFTFKRIEDKLPDFSGRSYGLFRNIWGINASYHQWSVEENQHSDALALILEATGHLSHEAIEADYYDNLTRTWEVPFATPRQMVLYAAFQEQLTHLSYESLAKRAVEEGAPLIGQVMQLVSQDEAYHGGGYRAFARVFAELDLQGTIEDALHVAANFRMPAQHLMRNRRRDSVDIVRVGAFSKQLVSESTIYHVLRGLRFVPEHLARQAAARYWSS
jgi:acyl-[acyl-carrier-protein] desaturase